MTDAETVRAWGQAAMREAAILSAPALRVAIIGCGLIGGRRAEVARASGTGEVAIVADVDESRAAALAQAHGCDHTADWKAVVSRDDVEAVVVSTTHRWLAPITITALQHGKHVLVEKPMACTLAEAEAVVGEMGKHPGLRVGVGFNHRHHAAVSKAHELLTQGAIGEVMFARCRYGHGGRPGYDNEWRADKRLSRRGGLLDQGMHAIDLFRWFLGDFAEATGFVQTYMWKTAQNGHGDH